MSELTDKLESARRDAELHLMGTVESVLRTYRTRLDALPEPMRLILDQLQAAYDVEKKATETYRAALKDDIAELLGETHEPA